MNTVRIEIDMLTSEGLYSDAVQLEGFCLLGGKEGRRVGMFCEKLRSILVDGSKNYLFHLLQYHALTEKI